MELKPLYKDRIYVPVESSTTTYYCPSCGEPLVDGNGERLFDSFEIQDVGICNDCGITVSCTDVFMVFDMKQYDGCSTNDVTLLANGKEIACAYIKKSDCADGVDIARLHVYGTYENSDEKNTEKAQILRDFAKYVRFDWRPIEKTGELPTLVRLMGCIDRGPEVNWRNRFEWFIALPNALEIRAEHLKDEFLNRKTA